MTPPPPLRSSLEIREPASPRRFRVLREIFSRRRTVSSEKSLPTTKTIKDVEEVPVLRCEAIQLPATEKSIANRTDEDRTHKCELCGMEYQCEMDMENHYIDDHGADRWSLELWEELSHDPVAAIEMI